MTCRNAGKVSCVQCAATYVCFQEIKVFTGKQNFFKYTFIKFVAVQSTVFE